MKKLFDANLHYILIYFLSSCNIFDALSIEVATTVPPHVRNILKEAKISDLRDIINGTRRIISGEKVTSNRPYMVYLKLPITSQKYREYRNWLCGGVIIHEEYILTSAACIEDAKHFYVVSGTYKYDGEFNRHNNPCIKYGAKKAIWKCIPRNYVFDGHENDNIRWMNNDIAIVKVEDEFDFNRRIRGCDFIPQPIQYNNFSKQLEDAGNEASIVGWGSTEKYNDWINHRAQTFSQDLLETNVRIINKRACKKRWGPRYHNIIDNYMICTKDTVPELSEYCREKYVDCTDVMYSEEAGETEGRRQVMIPKDLVLHSAHHNTTRRSSDSGGFCENDHGGPLVHGTGPNAVVIGIISACLVKEETNICYGPFLYTSVYKNRMLITCAIYKDIAVDCNKLFRSSETHTETDISWADHPDGPAKNEIKEMRRNEEAQEHNIRNIQNATERKHLDKVIRHDGIILRTFDDTTKDKNSTNFT